MKIGFFGGTFNPPHKGHEKIIDYSLKLFDELLIFPNTTSPDKTVCPPIDYKHRINMLKLITKESNAKIDTYEIMSKVSNYTYYTVKYLLNKYKNCDLVMIVGKDQLLNLKNWYNADFIIQNTEVLCFNRIIDNCNNQDMVSLYSNTQIIDFDFPYSSSVIREKLHKHKTIDNSLISEKIKDYIYEHNLYT